MNKKHLQFFWVLMFFIMQLLSVTSDAHAFAGSAVKLIDEAIEIAARLSGKSLTAASREAARQQLGRAMARHGDDVLAATRKGGFELMEAATRYGDDVWKYAAKVPEASLALATRPQEILPLVRRAGTDVLRLETKIPGISSHISRTFGEKAVSFFYRSVPQKDMTRLISYANRAKTPEAKKLLLSTYKKGGTKFLNQLDWETIVATGLSASMIISAYKISDGVEDGLKNISQNSPEIFGDTVNHLTDRLTFPFILTFCILGGGLALIYVYSYYRKKRGRI